MASDRSELIIVSGRRRIGKTYLVDTYFKRKYDFTSLVDMATGKRYSIFNTFVTTYGVVDGKYKSIVDSEVTMDDLFNS